MKIGFDAKWFFHGPPSGRMVVASQVAAIAGLELPHDLYLFLDDRCRGKPLPFDDQRWHKVYVWAGNNLVANVWHVTQAAQRLRLDAVWYQNFVPPRARFARVAHVYDAIFESHPQYYSWRERLYFKPLRPLARCAERVCTISVSEKARLVRYGYARPECVDVAYLGVSERFRPATEFDLPELTRVRARYGLPNAFLLYVGRLNVRKNIGNLLRALRLLEGDVKMPIVIAGSPDWKNPGLASLLATLAIRPIFTGSVEDRDLPALYAMASVFCFPSYEEGFGLPPLEAMACGVPVVVSDRSSLPEVCGNAGTYANPDDPEAIATAIQSLLVDEGLALKKRALGLERAGHFSWQNSARGVMASITAAVGRTK